MIVIPELSNVSGTEVKDKSRIHFETFLTHQVKFKSTRRLLRN